jgi:hypothetical protein
MRDRSLVNIDRCQSGLIRHSIRTTLSSKRYLQNAWLLRRSCIRLRSRPHLHLIFCFLGVGVYTLTNSGSTTSGYPNSPCVLLAYLPLFISFFFYLTFFIQREAFHHARAAAHLLSLAHLSCVLYSLLAWLQKRDFLLHFLLQHCLPYAREYAQPRLKNALKVVFVCVVVKICALMDLAFYAMICFWAVFWPVRFGLIQSVFSRSFLRLYVNSPLAPYGACMFDEML